MLGEIVRHVSFKYAVWIATGVTSITLGYWYAKLTALEIDPSALEFSPSAMMEATRSGFVLLFHMVFTFIGLRESATTDALRAKAESLASQAASKLELAKIPNVDLALFQSEVDAGRIGFASPPREGGDVSAHFAKIVADLEDATPPIASGVVLVREGVPRKAIDQAILLAKHLQQEATSSSLDQVEALLRESAKATEAFESATSETKVERVLNGSISVLFVASIVYWVFTSSWLMLAPIAGGTLLGWLLAHSEKMVGVTSRTYYPYLVATALAICFALYGHREALSRDSRMGEVHLTNDDTIAGDILFQGTHTVVVRVSNGTLAYINAGHVRMLESSASK